MQNTKTLLVALLGLFMLTRMSLADALPSQLLAAAEKMIEVLKDKERDSVALGDFGPKVKGAEDAFGPGLRVELAQAFAELARQNKKINLVDKTDFVLSGTYEVIDDPDDKGSKDRLLVIKIELTLRSGAEVIFPHTFFVDRIRDIIKAEGVSGLFKLEDTTREIHKQIREAEKKPPTVLQSTRIKSNPNSPYSVEIRTVPVLSIDTIPAKPRTPEARDGSPFVSIAKGEVYEVVVFNDSSEEIAVGLSIDGIDQFTFSEDRDERTGQPKFSHWIVGKNSELKILGWHKTADPKRKDNVLRF